MRFLAMPIFFLVLLATLGGCDAVQFKGGAKAEPHASGNPGTHHTPPAWPFRPKTILVDPFSSIGYEERTEQWVVEARVTLLDAEGHPTKGLGRVRLELYELDAKQATAAQGRRLEFWNDSIADPAAGKEHYDDLTHGYVFYLRMKSPPPSAAMKLLVQFTDDRGERMLGEALVQKRASGAPDQP